MGKIYFLIALLLTLVASVGLCQPSAPPVLIVLVIDASKSALPVPKPTVRQLREIETLVNQQRTGGTLAFAVIGNPKPEYRHFYRCDLDAIPVIPPGAALYTRKRFAGLIKESITYNQQQTGDWINQYQQVVLQYKPNGPELSKISEVFSNAVLLLREPSYRNYLKVLVFCSDLKNEPKHPNIVVPWSINLNGIPRLIVVGTGANDPNPLTGLSNYIVLADISGLVSTLKVILNQ